MKSRRTCFYIFFFFNDTATTEIYTLSLHDALPISPPILGREFYVERTHVLFEIPAMLRSRNGHDIFALRQHRSEEHTSELQSQSNLVCRLLLEKKKKNSLLGICVNFYQVDCTYART